MAQLKSTNVIGNLSVTGLSKATDFKGITAELSGAVSIGGETNISGAVSISGETSIGNVLSAKKLLIKNDNGVTIGHTYTGGNYLEFVLGNSTATSATNGTQGYLYLYGTGTNWTKFVSGNPTANNTLTLPTASGTIALTSNIPGAEKGITLTNGKYGHSNTAITAGSVGSAQSPSHGGTFAIPKITYDAYGHITGATTVNITLPSDTDTKVTQTVTTTNAKYPLLLAPSGQTATATTTSYFDSGITLNPSTNIISGAKLEYIYNTAPTQPDAVIKIGSHNFDVNIFKVYDRDSGFNANGGYGYSLMYNGTGSGVSNALTLYCDNTSNDPCIGWQLNQQGYLGLGQAANTTHRLAVKGHTAIDGYLTARTGSYYGELNFAPTMSGSTMGHILYYVAASGDTTFNRGHFTFREYSYTSGSTTKASYYEQYVLPDVNTGRTANVTYNILTTKNAVTVAQGGTGATSLTNKRMVYTKTDSNDKTVLTAGYHYVDDTHVAVGSTSVPDYALYVGTSNDAAGTLGVAKSITITNTKDAIGHLNFSRASYNYITAPAGGSVAFDVSGTGGGSSAPCDLVVSDGELIPGTTKGTNLGSSSKQWNSIYANNIVLSSTTNSSQTAASTPGLRIGASDSAIHMIIDRDAINAKATSTSAGTLNINESGGQVIIGPGGLKTSGSLIVENTTASTSMTTGALKVSGGVGVAGQLNAKTVRVDNSVYFQYNSTNECLDVIFG